MYLEFFGLKKMPFSMTADPQFLYLTAQYREALAFLIFGIQERKGFLEITGEIGTGKTTLCKTLINWLGDQVQTAFLLHPDFSDMQLLQAILEDLGINSKARSRISLLRRLNDYLLQQYARGGNVVLIIDEAQNLKKEQMEQIRLLSNLETDEEKLIQILLSGQPELRKKLASPHLRQLRQRISVRFHLRPLQREEVPSYIGHRLRVAGSNGSVAFTERAIQEIAAYSGGTPRLINIVCDRALLAAFVGESREIDASAVRRSIREIEQEGESP